MRTLAEIDDDLATVRKARNLLLAERAGVVRANGQRTTLSAYLHARRGRLRDLAKAIGIAPSTITQWARVPAERVLDVERLTSIPRTDLRPDLYGGT